jgi:hypothetical protein
VRIILFAREVDMSDKLRALIEYEMDASGFCRPEILPGLAESSDPTAVAPILDSSALDPLIEPPVTLRAYPPTLETVTPAMVQKAMIRALALRRLA